MEKYIVCGVPICKIGRNAATESIVQSASKRRKLEVHLCNTYTLSLVQDDAELHSALLNADLNIADGAPLAWLGSFDMSGLVRGPSLFNDVVHHGRRAGIRHYLYGGKVDVAAAVAENLTRSSPGTQIVGVETPPFHRLDDSELNCLAQRVARSGADIVWVGLGTPRQDYLVPRLARAVGLPVVPVGAAFDFVAGTVREAPKWLQGSGFEWIYRLSREPRRLWRRYLIGSLKFARQVMRERLER